jgi:DNA-binding NarL/FixJ family response regulator
MFEKYEVHKKAVTIRDEIILTKLMNGVKRQKIAKDLEISIRSVNAVAEKNNVYRLKKKERDEKIIQAYASGLLYKEIAKEFNISKATITRVIKQHNKDYNSKLY